MDQFFPTDDVPTDTFFGAWQNDLDEERRKETANKFWETLIENSGQTNHSQLQTVAIRMEFAIFKEALSEEDYYQKAEEKLVMIRRRQGHMSPFPDLLPTASLPRLEPTGLLNDNLSIGNFFEGNPVGFDHLGENLEAERPNNAEYNAYVQKHAELQRFTPFLIEMRSRITANVEKASASHRDKLLQIRSRVDEMLRTLETPPREVFSPRVQDLEKLEEQITQLISTATTGKKNPQDSQDSEEVRAQVAEFLRKIASTQSQTQSPPQPGDASPPRGTMRTEMSDLRAVLDSFCKRSMHSNTPQTEEGNMNDYTFQILKKMKFM